MTNYQVENQRQAYLDALYALDRRDDPSHPLHSTYTGLYLQRQQQLLERDKAQQLTPSGSSCAV
jgi:hypothetical protein